MADDFPDDESEEREDDARRRAEAEMPNAADLAAQKRARRKQRQRTRESAEFWQQVFASPVGRREMWGLLVSAHAFEERFACGPTGFPQVEATWFHAGEQAFGLRLFQSWLVHARDGVMVMLDEHDARFAAAAKERR